MVKPYKGEFIMKTKKANNIQDDVFSVVKSDGTVVTQFTTNPETEDSTQHWLQFGVDLKNRSLALIGEVNEGMSDFVLRAITKLNEINHDPITIYLQTYGGGVYEGFSIYDILTNSPSPVIMKASGKIASMGIVIFLAGTERYATDSTRFMIHSLSHGTEGKLKDTLVDVAEAKISNDMMYKIISSRSKLTVKSLNKISGDFWFGVAEAKKYGIIKELKKKGK